MDTIEPEQFDENNSDLVGKIDEVIDAFNKLDTTDGANNIQITAINVIGTMTKLQDFLSAFVTRLQAVADNASGADLVGVTNVIGVTGTTVQSVLEGLKAYTDSLQTVLAATNGSGMIGTPAISGVSGTTVKDQLAGLRTLIAQTTLGQIPDGTLTNAKLNTDIKVGSLTTLKTTNKSSITSALNELYDVASVKLTTHKNSVTIDSETNRIDSGITDFIPDKDIMLVFINSTFQMEGSDYTISEDSLGILKISGTWQVPTIADFVVIKNLQQAPQTTMDGQLITDGSISTVKISQNTITNSRLGVDVKVGSLALLTTSVKTDVVSAINEIRQIPDDSNPANKYVLGVNNGMLYIKEVV
jgi:hypothetical protein